MADPAANLIDIIGPASPAHTASPLAGILAWSLGAVALIAVAAWLMASLPVWRTRLALWRLRRAHRARRVDTREASYRLAAELRRHYRVHRLDALSLPWNARGQSVAVLRRLDRLRYGPAQSHRASHRPEDRPLSSVQWRRVCEVAARRVGRRVGRLP